LYHSSIYEQLVRVIEIMETIYHARKCCDEYNYHIISTHTDARLIVFQELEIDGIQAPINIHEEQLDIDDLLAPKQTIHLTEGFERVY